jgi:hypothetical protein
MAKKCKRRAPPKGTTARSSQVRDEAFRHWALLTGTKNLVALLVVSAVVDVLAPPPLSAH